MDNAKIRQLMSNGIFLSFHAKDKMRFEHVNLEQIKETLLNGVAVADNSKQNYKRYAWNNSQHLSVYSESLNLTVVFCESKEKAILVISVYHGKSHNISSNPYYKKWRF